MKLNKNITSLLSEAKTKFSDDEHEVKLYYPECFLCLSSFVTFVSSQTSRSPASKLSYLGENARAVAVASPLACLSRVYFSRYPPNGELARRLTFRDL